MVSITLGWLKHVRKGSGWPSHNNRAIVFDHMQSQQADWIEMPVEKRGGSHGSLYPVVKFMNAYEEVMFDQSETLNSFPEAYDIDFLNSHTSETSLRTTNAKVVLESLTACLCKLKVGDSKKARDTQHPVARGLQDLQKSLEHHEKELERFKNVVRSKMQSGAVTDNPKRRRLEKTNSEVNCKRVVALYNYAKMKGRRFAANASAQNLSARTLAKVCASSLDFDIANCMFVLVRWLIAKLGLVGKDLCAEEMATLDAIVENRRKVCEDGLGLPEEEGEKSFRR